VYTVLQAVANDIASTWLPPGKCVRLIVVIEPFDTMSGDDQFHVFVESRTSTSGEYERSPHVLDVLVGASDPLVVDAANVDLSYPQHNLNVDFQPDPMRVDPMVWRSHIWAIYE